MESWQSRLIQEKVDLSEKILKLEDYLHGSERTTTERQWTLLKRQIVTMRDYRDILDQRIEEFTAMKA